MMLTLTLNLCTDYEEDIKEELLAKYHQVELSKEGHLQVPVSLFFEFMFDLKENFGFDYLSNITAVDYLDYIKVIYNPCRIGSPEMLHIIVQIDRENPQIPSMVPIWGGAIWQEREVYDLLGVVFTKHPDLRRILLDDNWEGYPLRKDYQWESGRR